MTDIGNLEKGSMVTSSRNGLYRPLWDDDVFSPIKELNFEFRYIFESSHFCVPYHSK